MLSENFREQYCDRSTRQLPARAEFSAHTPENVQLNLGAESILAFDVLGARPFRPFADVEADGLSLSQPIERVARTCGTMEIFGTRSAPMNPNPLSLTSRLIVPLMRAMSVLAVVRRQHRQQQKAHALPGPAC